MEEIKEIRYPQLNKSRDFSRFGLWAAVLYTSSFNVIGIIIGLVILLVLSFAGIELTFTEEPYPAAELYFNLAINAIAIILVGLTFLFLNRRINFIPSEKKPFNLTRKDGKIIGLAILAIFTIVGIIQIVPELIREHFFSGVIIETPYDFFKSDNLGVICFATFITCIFSPISEEIFFRWSLISILKNGYNKNATILFSALVFSLAHSTTDLNYSFYYFTMHFFTTFLIGIVLGIVFLHLNKILPVIIIHAIWNFILSLSGFFEFANIGWIYNIIFYIIVSCCFLGSLCYVIVIFLRNKKKKSQEKSAQIATDETLISQNKIENKKTTKIKLKWEWFELILAYFLLIVILPILLQSSAIFFDFLQGYIDLVYFLVIGIISIFVLQRVFNERLRVYFPEEFVFNSKSTEQIENKEREENP